MKLLTRISIFLLSPITLTAQPTYLVTPLDLDMKQKEEIIRDVTDSKAQAPKEKKKEICLVQILCCPCLALQLCAQRCKGC